MKDKNTIHNMASCMLSILDSLKLYDNNSLVLDGETLSELMFRKMEGYNIDLNEELGYTHLSPVSGVDAKKNKIPNVFELNWSWYEEDHNYHFFHDNKTPGEFDKDIKFLLKKYGDEYIDNSQSWIGINDWVAFISDKMPELGYILVEPIASCSFFGGYILNDKENENVDKFKEYVGSELLEKAFAKNKEIENETYNDIEK